MAVGNIAATRRRHHLPFLINRVKLLIKFRFKDEPPARKAGVMVASVDELVEKLKNEAHVL